MSHREKVILLYIAVYGFVLLFVVGVSYLGDYLRERNYNKMIEALRKNPEYNELMEKVLSNTRAKLDEINNHEEPEKDELIGY